MRHANRAIKNAAFNRTDAAQLLEERYGVRCKIIPLTGEVDLNYLVITPQWQAILKVSLGPNSVESASYQSGLIEHLSRTVSDANFPTGFSSLSGKFVEEFVSKGVAGSARLMRFLPGCALSEFQELQMLSFEIGRFTGRLVAALNTFKDVAPAAPKYWNILNTGAQRLRLDCAADSDEADLISDVLENGDHRLQLHDHLPEQVIHGDLNRQNMFIDVSKGRFGAIDFGESHVSLRIIDLVLPLSFLIDPSDTEETLTATSRCLKGFLTECSVLEAELDCIPDLIALRFSNLILSSRSLAKKHQDRAAYIQKNTAHALLSLKWLKQHKGILEKVLSEANATEAQSAKPI